MDLVSAVDLEIVSEKKAVLPEFQPKMEMESLNKDNSPSKRSNRYFVHQTATYKASLSNPALAEVNLLLQMLANPSLSPQDRIRYREALFEILSGQGAASEQYGAISGPITNVGPDGLAQASAQGSELNPNQSAWQKSSTGTYPTNDWFEQIANYPGKTGLSSSGYYQITYNPNGGLEFRVPISFQDNEDPNDPNHGCIGQTDSQGITFDTTGHMGQPVVNWEGTGNMLRDVCYNGLTIHAAQGSFFTSATYANATPGNLLQIPGSVCTESTLADGTKKYRIQAPDGTVYLFYGNSSLNLQFDASTGTLSGTGPYNGSINAAILAKGSNIDESLVDAHANCVIVKAVGSLLPNGQYAFSYVTQDLSGNPSSIAPLVVLKQHEMNDLITNQGGSEKENGNVTTLAGNMGLYSGASFLFQAKSPNASLDPLPGSPITADQANQLIQSGALDQGIQDALNTTPANVYDGGKALYKMSLTLAYAVKVLEAAGYTSEQIQTKLAPLYEKIKQAMSAIFGRFEYDNSWGSIVPKADDYGAHTMMNDHIVQYGYTLYSLTLLAQYEDQFPPSGAKFLDQPSGIGSYSNKDLGDLIASDIGETGTGKGFPQSRNFDIYNGHSWLSGIVGPANDGNDTESESEAVFGSMSIAAWLQETQPGSTQAEIAKTRWAIETESLQTYYQIGDPSKSVYNAIAPGFAEKHPVVSMIWDDKIVDETWWGLNWDRILACETMPAGANMVDNYLNNNPAFAKRAADYILANWSNFDTQNNIQSVLIAIVAKAYPDQARNLTQDMQKNHPGNWDTGTNAFIMQVIADHCQNNP